MDAQPEADVPDGATGDLYCIIVTPGDGQMDEQLATAMEEVYKASARDPNRWHNNPEKKRKALEGLPLLAARSLTQQLGEDPTQRLVFAVTGWGFSLIESGEIQRSSTTGALIALDRGSRTVLSRLQTAFDKGDEVQVPAGVIGQAWRQPNQHALLSHAL